MRYKNLEHTADLKIRSYGKNLEQVFANMAIGMYENIFDKKDVIKEKRVKHNIKIKSADTKALLVDFLSELVSLSDINNEVYLDYKIKIRENELIAQVRGNKIKGLKLEIKAVTYNDLKIAQEKDLWIAEVVFDI